MTLVQRALTLALKNEGDAARNTARPCWLAWSQQGLGEITSAAANARPSVEAAERAFGPEHEKTKQAPDLLTSLEAAKR